MPSRSIARREGAGLDGLVHLTTRQYAAHRRQILEAREAALGEGKPCRLIATSLVEAGVDLDFPKVWRAEAGLDQIAQAAGRCNREGKRPVDESLVTVFTAPDNPPPAEIRGFSGDMARMCAQARGPAVARGDGGLLRRGLLACRTGGTGPGLDRQSISSASASATAAPNFSYRSVAEKFRMIESGMVPVIIARDEAAQGGDAAACDRSDTVGRNRPSSCSPTSCRCRRRARAQLIERGHVKFAEEPLRDDQFAVLDHRQPLRRPRSACCGKIAEYLARSRLSFTII